MNNNQIKLEVHDTCKNYEKITTDFEPVNNEDVINKAYLDENFLKINGQISLLKKDYNNFKLQYNKHFVEEFLIQRAVKTTLQLPYDEDLFDTFQKADKVLKDFFTTKRRLDLSEQVNDDIQ